MRVRKAMNPVLCTVLVAAIAVAALAAGPGPKAKTKPRDVTVTGRVVDLHSYMTGKLASGDPARSTRACIQAGVPAAIETTDGLIIVGQGKKGPQKTLARLAYQRVEIKGRLYERGGLRYIDMSSATPTEVVNEPTEAESDDPVYVDPESEEPDEPEPYALSACCLPDGDCVETDEAECAESGGEFHRGKRCDDIMCTPYDP